MNGAEAIERLSFQTDALVRSLGAAPEASEALDAARALTNRLAEHGELVAAAEATATSLGHDALVGFAEVEHLEQRLEAMGELAATSYRSLQAAADADRAAEASAAVTLERLQVLLDDMAEYRAALDRRSATSPWSTR